jgi:HEAT repeat protein
MWRSVDEAVAQIRDSQQRFSIEPFEYLRGNKSDYAVRALIDLMENECATVRCGTALTLGRMGAKQASQSLCQHARDEPVADVRRYCVAALGRIGGNAAMRAIVDALADSNQLVVSRAAVELGDFGDVAPVEIIRKLLTHASWQVRLSACQSLMKIRAIDDGVTRCLECLNGEPDADEYNEFVTAYMASYVRDEDGDCPLYTTTELLSAAKEMLAAVRVQRAI